MTVIIIAAIFILAAILVGERSGLGAFLALFQKKQEAVPLDEAGSKFHSPNFFELKKTIMGNLGQADPSEAESSPLVPIGITSHHLPLAAVFMANFYNRLAKSAGPRDTLVILGPDHFEICAGPVSVTKKSYLTPFGELGVDDEIIDEILKSGATLDDECFEREHSVGAQTIFIKYLFSQAKIVPLLFSASTQDSWLNRLAEALSKYQNKITIIASVDFSHYQKYEVARELDEESESMIKEMDVSAISLKQADSPPAIKLTLLLAKKLGLKPEILGRANSADFTGQTENTTGYLNVIFGR